MKGRFKRSMAGMAATTLALAGLMTAGSPLWAADAPTPATAGAGPTDADLMGDATSTGDVLTYGMGPRAQRFSPLARINADNVQKLVPAFAASLGGEKQRGQESQPLVYDGTIYVTGSYSRLFAFDARTGISSYSFFLARLAASAGLSSVTMSPSFRPPVTITSSSFCLPT